MMNVSDFAKQIKSKYPQYNNLSDQELVDKVVSKYPQYKSQVNTEGAVTGPLNQGIDATLGKIPLAGGLLSGAAKGIVDPLSKTMELSMQEGNNPLIGLNVPTGVKTITGQMNQPNKYMSSQDYQAATSPNVLSRASAALGPQVGTALDALTAGDIPGIMGGLKAGGAALKELPSYLTKSGLAQKSTEAARAATEAGTKISWGDISKDIQSQVYKQLGKTKDVQDALNTIISEKTPAGLESMAPDVKIGGIGTSMSPSDLLDWRRQILGREGTGILKALTGSNVTDKVSSIARSVISKNLHDYVPATVTPDKLFSFYSAIKGDVPTWAKRAVGGFLADKLIGSKLGGLPQGVVDSLGLLLGGGF